MANELASRVDKFNKKMQKTVMLQSEKKIFEEKDQQEAFNLVETYGMTGLEQLTRKGVSLDRWEFLATNQGMINILKLQEDDRNALLTPVLNKINELEGKIDMLTESNKLLSQSNALLSENLVVMTQILNAVMGTNTVAPITKPIALPQEVIAPVVEVKEEVVVPVVQEPTGNEVHEIASKLAAKGGSRRGRKPFRYTQAVELISEFTRETPKGEQIAWASMDEETKEAVVAAQIIKFSYDYPELNIATANKELQASKLWGTYLLTQRVKALKGRWRELIETHAIK